MPSENCQWPRCQHCGFTYGPWPLSDIPRRKFDPDRTYRPAGQLCSDCARKAKAVPDPTGLWTLLLPDPITVTSEGA